jgi:hypothetical protein
MRLEFPLWFSGMTTRTASDFNPTEIRGQRTEDREQRTESRKSRRLTQKDAD